jgi:hypothetical protein
MATLTIKDLTASKELDGKAMAAVAGGTSPELAALVLGYTSIATSFPVYNAAENYSLQANEVGSFNFGVVNQSNNSGQYIDQAGNLLGAV